MPQIDGINIPFIPAGGSKTLKNRSDNSQQKGLNSQFGKILTEELNSIKFSAHAETRLKSRGIEFTNQDMSRLTNAFSNAEKKGAKDSLVVMDNKAFIINVPNKTVVTALDKLNLNSNVITNIDSAIIA